MDLGPGSCEIIAQRLVVTRPQVVHEWRRRHADFPEPVASLVGLLSRPEEEA